MTSAATHEGLAAVARAMLSAAPGPSVAARVVDIKGFSTWAGDELVVVDQAGVQHGQVLGAAGAARVLEAARPLLAGAPELATAVVEIHGRDVEEAGLSCGGRAELLLQPTASIPGELWTLLAERAPAALVTRIEGPGAAASSLVVGAGGRTWGRLAPASEAAVDLAARLVADGHSATRRVEDEAGTVLVEAWVPTPRLVVVGAGDLVGAIEAQARLLGWETTAVGDRPDPAVGAGAVSDGDEPGGSAGDRGPWPTLTGAFEWAGASAALVVLSHDPHVDVPSLGAAIDAGIPYIGAMGSRRTQSRRLDRLTAAGRGEAELERIHRPVGLDLGGRSAPEVAIAICAEILAAHCGRDARPLRDHDGPINDRPTA
jgi:xanthine dehydrogenase accessory factor